MRKYRDYFPALVYGNRNYFVRRDLISVTVIIFILFNYKNYDNYLSINIFAAETNYE